LVENGEIFGPHLCLSPLQGLIQSEFCEGVAALFYSPVDFTDASDLHQTVVKFIG